MLKIYNIYQNQGKIELTDYIDINNGRFFTGYDGYGDIFTEGIKTFYASYVLQHLKSFKKYLQSIKVIDGYLQNFILFNAYSEAMLKERTKGIPKTTEAYQKNGLNEEAILLFTDYVNMRYDDNNNIKRLYGRSASTGMYLLMPNATFDIYNYDFGRHLSETYEVMQSKNLGKQLILTKLPRKIK